MEGGDGVSGVLQSKYSSLWSTLNLLPIEEFGSVFKVYLLGDLLWYLGSQTAA